MSLKSGDRMLLGSSYTMEKASNLRTKIVSCLLDVVYIMSSRVSWLYWYNFEEQYLNKQWPLTVGLFLDCKAL